MPLNLFLIIVSLFLFGISGSRYSPAIAQATPLTTTTAHDATHLGPLIRFARTVERPPSSQGAVHKFTLRAIELRPADDRRILVEGVVAHLRIANPARFERAYARDTDSMASATARVQVGFEEELRRAVGRLTLPQLAAFDPFVLVDESTRLRRLLDQVGLAIDDIGGERMGYRVLVR